MSEKGELQSPTVPPNFKPYLIPTSELRLHSSLENSEDGTGFTHGHGDPEGSFPVPGGVQDLIRAVFCEKNEPNKLGVIGHELSLKRITVRQARSRSSGK